MEGTGYWFSPVMATTKWHPELETWDRVPFLTYFGLSGHALNAGKSIC